MGSDLSSWTSSRGHAIDRFDSVVLEHGVREESPAHLVGPRPRGVRALRLDLQLDDLPDADRPHLAEAESAERPLDRGALHVENAGLQPDEDAQARGHPTAFG